MSVAQVEQILREQCGRKLLLFHLLFRPFGNPKKLFHIRLVFCYEWLITFLIFWMHYSSHCIFHFPGANLTGRWFLHSILISKSANFIFKCYYANTRRKYQEIFEWYFLATAVIDFWTLSLEYLIVQVADLNQIAGKIVTE